MFERLGLFAIIVFGEVVLGVVNGISKIPELNLSAWLNFALAISIVFSLWWIFFTLVAQREVKSGFTNATLLELLYIPTIISLGLIAVSFSLFFDSHSEIPVQKLGYAVATFLICIDLMMELLVTRGMFHKLKKRVQISLMISALLFFVFALIDIRFHRMYYLIGVISILVIEIIYLNSLYYRMKSREEQ